MVARLGFEPRQTDPESVVLPLHHRAERINVTDASLIFLRPVFLYADRHQDIKKRDGCFDDTGTDFIDQLK